MDKVSSSVNKIADKAKESIRPSRTQRRPSLKDFARKWHKFQSEVHVFYQKNPQKVDQSAVSFGAPKSKDADNVNMNEILNLGKDGKKNV